MGMSAYECTSAGKPSAASTSWELWSLLHRPVRGGCAMSAPSADWVEVLHALSVGLPLKRSGKRWLFEGIESAIDDQLVASLMDRGFVRETRRDSCARVEITGAGKRALFAELQ